MMKTGTKAPSSSSPSLIHSYFLSSLTSLLPSLPPSCSFQRFNQLEFFSFLFLIPQHLLLLHLLVLVLPLPPSLPALSLLRPARLTRGGPQFSRDITALVRHTHIQSCFSPYIFHFFHVWACACHSGAHVPSSHDK